MNSISSIRRVALALFGLVAALLLASACSSSGGSKSASGGGSSTGGGSAASGNTVEVVNFSFEPQNLDVKVGTKVTWKFEDSAAHNVAAKDDSFKSEDLKKGQEYSYTFNKAGTYDYYCTIHQYMTGSVTAK